MLHARSVVLSLTLAGALAFSANALADNGHHAEGRGDDSGARSYNGGPNRSEKAWARDAVWLSKAATAVAAGVSSGASSGREAAEGLGRGLGLGEGAERGRGGAAPAPLLGLTLFGQIAIAGGLFVALRRRQAKGQKA